MVKLSLIIPVYNTPEELLEHCLSSIHDNLHYIGCSETDIRHFIDDVVIEGNDPMFPLREQFYTDYLLPPEGKSVAQNILDDIIPSLSNV